MLIMELKAWMPAGLINGLRIYQQALPDAQLKITAIDQMNILKNKKCYCFWCDQLTDRVTKDHILSKPMRRYFTSATKEIRQKLCPGKFQQKIVYCCYDCNQERSRISSLFCNLTSLRKKMSKKGSLNTHEEKRNRNMLRSFFKNKSGILHLFSKYREKISEKLEGNLKNLCLKEINEVDPL